MKPLPLKALSDLAITAAREAGAMIASSDRTQLQHTFKDAGSSAASQLVTELDVRCEAHIYQRLRRSCQQWDIAFVGEETSSAESNQDRQDKPYFWCVDPLDGSLPFVEGRPGYAVSIALVEQSGAPLLGVVYDPVTDSVLHAIRGQGAFRDQQPAACSNITATSLMAFADDSFRTQANYATLVETLHSCAEAIGASAVELVYGSGAVKNACQILDCAAACYVKTPKAEAGGGSIWDFAASACIVSEAGGWVSNIRGEPLDLNRKDSTFMNHQGVVYASGERIGSYLIEALQGLGY